MDRKLALLLSLLALFLFACGGREPPAAEAPAAGTIEVFRSPT